MVTNARQKRPAAARKKNKRNIFLEIDALSAVKPQDRLRLAHLASKAGHQTERSDALDKLRKRFDTILTDVLPIVLADKGNLVRVEALEIIAEHALVSFEPEAIHALQDKDPLVQDRAVWASAAIKTPAAIKAVKRFLPKLQSKARVSAEGFLYTIDRDGHRVDRLIALLEDDSHFVRRASSHELAYIAPMRDMKRVVEAIETAIGCEQYRVQKLYHRQQIRFLRSRFAD
jgi:hypothetical protein